MRVYQRWILHVSCLAAVILMVAPSAHAQASEQRESEAVRKLTASTEAEAA